MSVVSLGEFFSHAITGEWGAEPTGFNDVIVFRAADFTKDCQLRLDGGVPREISPSKLKTRRLEKNNILIEKSGGSPDQPVGRAVLYEPQNEEQAAVCSNFIQKMIVKDCYDPSFVYYLLLFLYQKNATLPYQQQTTGIINLKLDEYLNFQINTYLDQSIQRKISSVLRSIDQQITLTRAHIKKNFLLKQGMMSDLFSCGIDSKTGKLRPRAKDAPEFYKNTPLGRLPREWRIEKFCHWLHTIDQGWSPNCESDITPHGDWGVLKTTAVTWQGYSSSENKALPKSLIARPQYEVKMGDVLMTRAGPNNRVGVVAYVGKTQKRLMLSDKLYRINVKMELSPFFTSLMLSSYYIQSQLEKNKTGLAESQSNISQEIIKNLWVIVPEHQEQKLIEEAITSLNMVQEKENLNLVKLVQQKSGLMQDLLTGKVPVSA